MRLGNFVFPLITLKRAPSYLEKVLYPQSYLVGIKVAAVETVTWLEPKAILYTPIISKFKYLCY